MSALTQKIFSDHHDKNARCYHWSLPRSTCPQPFWAKGRHESTGAHSLRECLNQKSRILKDWKAMPEIYISCVALSSPRWRCLSKCTSYLEMSDSTELSTWKNELALVWILAGTYQIFHSHRTKTMQDYFISPVQSTFFFEEVLDHSLGIDRLWVLVSNIEFKRPQEALEALFQSLFGDLVHSVGQFVYFFGKWSSLALTAQR